MSSLYWTNPPVSCHTGPITAWKYISLCFPKKSSGLNTLNVYPLVRFLLSDENYAYADIILVKLRPGLSVPGSINGGGCFCNFVPLFVPEVLLFLRGNNPSINNPMTHSCILSAGTKSISCFVIFPVSEVSKHLYLLNITILVGAYADAV